MRYRRVECPANSSLICLMIRAKGDLGINNPVPKNVETRRDMAIQILIFFEKKKKTEYGGHVKHLVDSGVSL